MHDPLVNGIYQPPLRQSSAIGYSGPLQQWYETNFDPTSGYTNRVEYKGMDWNQAQSLANYFSALRISVNLKNEHGVSTLTISDATGNYVIDKWELSVDREQPDMFENPLFLSLINSAAYPSICISRLRNALKNSAIPNFNGTNDIGWYALTRPLPPDPIYDSIGAITGWNTKTVSGIIVSAAAVNLAAVSFINELGSTFVGTYPGNYPVTGATREWTSANMIQLKQYFDAYQLGVTNFLRGKYKLRHTANIPAQWNSSVADASVECIYTIPQLLAECSSSQFIYPIPNYLAYKINNFVPYPVAAWTPYYTWGALKEKSDAVTAVNNRVDVTTEYLIDNICTLLYSLK
jgi:hypothetical protein